MRTNLTLDELMRALKKGRLHRRESDDGDGERRAGRASEPVFDRLDADIAHALMSINAVSVEIGEGFNVVALRGGQNRDDHGAGFSGNHAGGGILGGIQ